MSQLLCQLTLTPQDKLSFLGHSDACDRLQNWFKENYEAAHRIVPLKVSAPFHSSLMKPAEENLSAFLKR